MSIDWDNVDFDNIAAMIIWGLAIVLLLTDYIDHIEFIGMMALAVYAKAASIRRMLSVTT